MMIRTEAITDGIRGTVLNIQHFSVDDGPGIRTVVFLKGCPLRCAWCHNPESQRSHPEFLFRADKCIGCGVCTAVCASGAHRSKDGIHTLDRDKCTLCGTCTASCCADALEIAGYNVPVQEVMEEILTDRVFYRRSGGGITLSGGEPLTQPDFALTLLQACREQGIHTCTETCGMGDARDIMRMAAWTDTFLFDWKLTDDAAHRRCTGASNRPIQKNLALLAECGADIILRCPMIPGINTNASHYDGIAELANRHRIREIHLLPYHPMGIGKAASLGREAAYSRREFLEKSALTQVQAYISARTPADVRIL